MGFPEPRRRGIESIIRELIKYCEDVEERASLAGVVDLLVSQYIVGRINEDQLRGQLSEFFSAILPLPPEKIKEYVEQICRFAKKKKLTKMYLRGQFSLIAETEENPLSLFKI